LITIYKRIESKRDYLYFLEADKIALSIDGQNVNPRFFENKIWVFQRVLRKLEYLQNCGGNKLSLLKAKYDLRKLSYELGITISPNNFGAGLRIVHHGTIAINSGVKVGKNCNIHQGVTIGDLRGNVPMIGDNVWIGPNAVIVGGIRIVDGVAIGANSYVDKDVLESNISVAGAPARKINNKCSQDLGIWATDILDAKKHSKTPL
jgi:serine O-acetyltransferase